MSFVVDLAAGFAELFDAAEIGLTWNGGDYAPDLTPIILFGIPPAPDAIVALFVNPLGADATLGNSTFGLQVRLRADSQDPRAMLDLDGSLQNLLLGHWPLDLPNGLHVDTIDFPGGAPLQADDNERAEWSSNYTLRAYQPTPYRG